MRSSTVETFHSMASLGLLKPGLYKQETKSGILGVAIKEDYSVMMNQPFPAFSKIVDKDEISDSLNIEVSQLLVDLCVQVVSTGIRDINDLHLSLFIYHKTGIIF